MVVGVDWCAQCMLVSGRSEKWWCIQKAAVPNPFLDCRLLNRWFFFVCWSSELPSLLLSWFRPDLSLTLNPPSGYCMARERVLAGLGDMEEDISPKPLSLL